MSIIINHNHVSPLLQKLHWLSINCRIEHKISSLCYSSLSGTGPQYFSDLSQVCTPATCLRLLSDTRVLSIPSSKTKSYGQHPFAYQGPTIWNKLPLEIRHQGTIDGLKRAQKLICFDFSRHSLVSSILCCLEFWDITWILITVRACLTIMFSFFKCSWMMCIICLCL